MLVALVAAPFMMGPTTPGCPDCVFALEAVNVPTGAQKQYYFQAAPGHRYQVVLQSLGGNPNLYTRVGAPPTLTRFDCRPNLAGSLEEVCEVLSTSGGMQYLMVYAKSGPAGYDLLVRDAGK